MKLYHIESARKSQEKNLGLSKKGGVKYYPLNGKTFTPASSNVSFIAMDDSGPTDDLPQITGIRISRASSEQAELSFTPSKSGFVRYVITSGSYVTDHSKLRQGTVIPVTAGQQTTISFSPGGADYDDTLRLSFDLVSNTGTVSTAYGEQITATAASASFGASETICL